MEQLTLGLLESELAAAGYSRRARFDVSAPFVALVDVEGSLVGRFFPSRNAILVVRDRDEGVTRARVNHELAHSLNYARRCPNGQGRSRCGYRGDHDREFYRTLEQIHRRNGVPPSLAVDVEGRYPFPASWRRATW